MEQMNPWGAAPDLFQQSNIVPSLAQIIGSIPVGGAAPLTTGESGGMPGTDAFGGLTPEQWGSISGLFQNANKLAVDKMLASRPAYGPAAGVGSGGAASSVTTKEAKTPDIAPMMSLAQMLGFRG